MEYLGLFFELLILAFAVYLYMFATGRIEAKTEEAQQRADAFRKSNGGWLRILSLALAAIMLVNVLLHIMQLMG
ncbi:MAG: hypothetical protein DWQ02_02635 [Bacteroidetes bacterium]|nr:MAG: hypothetical protein DWQ02_02635 [Bacteroidota bacterium]